MKIHLKQGEITDALRQYVTKQGINLSGKTVDISFTAGRNGAGLSADIDIEDSSIPPMLEEEGTSKPILSVVPPPAAAPEGESAEDAKDTPVAAAAPEKATSSLFGG